MQPWTTSELKVVRDRWPNVSQIATVLDRTEASVWATARRIGLITPKAHTVAEWTPEQIAQYVRYPKRYPARVLAAASGLTVSAVYYRLRKHPSIRPRTRRRPVAPDLPKELLLDTTLSDAVLAEKLAKAVGTIRLAREKLGVRSRTWTREEESLLREHWPNRSLLREKLPHRSENALIQKAANLGLPRRRNQS